ncbi:MAG TPA: NUDIX hydrolase, partial [Myxococcaceae bacterium]|nr:NUDIX hydrolase [Myxococcaceae bacterium]
TAVDVTGKQAQPPRGDGSPLEEGTELQWRPIQALLAACRRGEVPDAKLEIAITRLLAEQA